MIVSKTIFKVGSLPWLIFHQLRLTIRGWKLSSAIRIALIAIFILFFFLPTSLALLVTFVASPEVIPEIRETILSLSLDPSYYYTASTIVPIALFFLILYFGSACVNTFTVNKDLELLLGSPLRRRTIVASQLLTITVQMSFGLGAFLSIFALPFLVLGIWPVLGIYILLISLSLLLTCLISCFIFACIDWFGIHAAKRILTLIFSLGYLFYFGWGFFINWIQGVVEIPNGVFQVFRIINSFVTWIIAGTLILSPPQTVVCVGLTGLITYFALDYITPRLVVPSEESKSKETKTIQREAQHRRTRIFLDDLTKLNVFKEWRLIWRGGNVVTIAASQIFLLILIVWNFRSVDIASVDSAEVMGMDWIQNVVAVYVIMMANSTAGALIGRMVLAEEALELLKSCPVPSVDLKSYKIIATLVPTFLLVLPVVFLLMWFEIPWQVPLVVAFFSSISTCLMGVWSARGQSKTDLFSRGVERKRDIVLMILSSIHGFLWVGFGFCVIALNPMTAIIGVLLLGGLLVVMAFAFWRSQHLSKLAYF